MSKVRINDLARELEVKSKAILDALPLVGVTEKKTHSSSIEEHEAEKVRAHIRGSVRIADAVCAIRAPAARRRRNQDQDRFVAHLPSGRRAEGDYAEEGSCGSASGPRPAAPPVAAEADCRASGSQADCLRQCLPPAAAPVPPAPVARPAVVPPPAEKTAAPWCRLRTRNGSPASLLLRSSAAAVRSLRRLRLGRAACGHRLPRRRRRQPPADSSAASRGTTGCQLDHRNPPLRA